MLPLPYLKLPYLPYESATQRQARSPLYFDPAVPGRKRKESRPCINPVYESEPPILTMLMTLRSNGIHNTQPLGNYTATDTVLQYTEESPLRTSSPRPQGQYSPSSNGAFTAGHTSRVTAKRKSPQMNGLLGNAPQAMMYVRALYDYEADDRTSLSFHEGDIIQVITQLDSGWWDGIINGVRGWFPSNYCQVTASPEDVPEIRPLETNIDLDEEDVEEGEEEQEQDDYEEYDEEEADSESNDIPQLAGTSHNDRTRADFWIPQATADGRLYYFNTETGEEVSDLPLESPSSMNETGPRDRMNVNIPDRTMPPADLTRNFAQDDDESDVNSASEMEGESLMLDSRSSYVSSIYTL